MERVDYVTDSIIDTLLRRLLLCQLYIPGTGKDRHLCLNTCRLLLITLVVTKCALKVCSTVLYNCFLHKNLRYD